jgi:hypothetical protein
MPGNTQPNTELPRKYLHNYLLSHPCVSYGETDRVVPEFHHIAEKHISVAEMITRRTSVERLQAELKKTQGLCANCHRRLTAHERAWFRSSK